MKNHPYLLQRLQKPYPVNDKFTTIGNPFSFGGGYINGGLSKEAFALFSQIWSYDYMGSAEFEFGALPESWQRIYKNQKQYVLGEHAVLATKTTYKTTPPSVEKRSAPVYYFCKKEDEQELREWLDKFADEVKHDFFTKEWVGLGQSILSAEPSILGWHDIDNDYLFLYQQGNV